MPNKSLLFFPGANVTIGGGGTGTFSTVVATGALTAGVPSTLVHGLGYANCAFIVMDATNAVNVDLLYADPLAPTTDFIIQTGIDLPGGLNVFCIGFA